MILTIIKEDYYMIDMLGNELASNVDELYMSELDDDIQNAHMIDKLGEKIEVDETSYDTILGSKIWDSVTSIPSFPLVYAGSKIWDSVTATPENHETPEERDNGKERSTHTSQDSSEDRVVSVRYDEAGRTIRKFESGKYEVFKPNGCADFYDSERNLTDSIC